MKERFSWRYLIAQPVMHLTGLSVLNNLYDQIVQRCTAHPEQHFVTAALQELDITLDIKPQALELIPKQGPVVLVANHPFGGLDGLALIELLRRTRPDVRVFANYLLQRIPELAEVSLYVDPFDSTTATHRNSTPLRAALRWLAEGHALGAFPAGEVAHESDGFGGFMDRPWNPVIAGLIQRSGATVVPVYFAGRNSRLFQLAGRVHPRLRTLLLPRELLRRRGERLQITIGHPISAERVARHTDPQELIDYLRARTAALRACSIFTTPRKHTSRQLQPLADALPGEVLANAIATLPEDTLLLRHGSVDVRCATAAQMPLVLPEIARLRELTFREVGEGAGQAVDRDRFDEHYDHLFLWDREAQSILGAYRLARTDLILDQHGPNGLYTNTLFQYASPLLTQLRGALELGRSFVVPEAQRSFTPLMLLWKGIARYVMRYPDYRGLFGAVSISDAYDAHTRQLLTHFLRINHYHANWAPDVHPRHPYRLAKLKPHLARELSTVASNLDDVEAVLDDIESSGRGIPILIRQYLRLDARVLGFNLDPEFGDALDALMYIDLPNASPRILSRFFGADDAATYCARHGVTSDNTLRAVS